LSAHEDGEVKIAFPLELIGKNESLASLLTLIFYGASYNYTKELWVEWIEFPKAFVSRFRGPRFGIQGVRNYVGIQDRPLIGLILKPRLGVSLEIIASKCEESLLGGVDFIVDDELILDRDSDLSFANRITKLMKIVNKSEKSTGQPKWYVANIGSSPFKSLKYAKIAYEEGVKGLLVNAFTMGFPVIDELIENLSTPMPITIHNMGVGILTRPLIEGSRRSTGVSDALIAKLSRLVGGDIIHAGISNSAWYHEEAWGDPIIALRANFHKILPTFAVAAGGLNIANIWDNISSLGSDVILEAGTGILGYPDGPRKGAAAFRKLVDTLNPNMTDMEAREAIGKLADNDKSFFRCLEYYGYGKNHSQ
jgi:ribulose 1,5-bisphosphate carboxylase large subunit-like protein